MSAHAFLPPSSAFRWVRCALSAALEAAFPETEESPESLEGTAAHWAVERLLQGTPAALDMQAPNGVAITQEMLEAAELVRDDIAGALGPDWRSRLFIEQRVVIPRIHPSQNWGTPDYYAWSQLDSGRFLLRIWDFKFGYGIVEARENWQMVDYAAGLLDAMKEQAAQGWQVLVEMVVIQPRAYHRAGPVRRWTVAASDLNSYFNRLANAAGLATSANAPAFPSPEGCRDCKGRHACEALMREAHEGMAQSHRCGRLDLPAKALGVELRALRRARKLMQARESGLEAEAVARLKRGELVPFWVMESTPGRLAWQKPVAEVLALGQMMGLDLAKPPEAITPTQAKAMAKSKKIPEALFDAFATRPAGAVSLVEDDGSAARLTFSSSNT